MRHLLKPRMWWRTFSGWRGSGGRLKDRNIEMFFIIPKVLRWHHDSAHLDCPLTAMEYSGHFFIAKFLNQEKTKIAITGFQVKYFTIQQSIF